MTLLLFYGTKMVVPNNIREHLEEIERRELSKYAALSASSKGRMKPEEPCTIRPAFQHDRDRIVHTKAFRRLSRRRWR